MTCYTKRSTENIHTLNFKHSCKLYDYCIFKDQHRTSCCLVLTFCISFWSDVAIKRQHIQFWLSNFLQNHRSRYEFNENMHTQFNWNYNTQPHRKQNYLQTYRNYTAINIQRRKVPLVFFVIKFVFCLFQMFLFAIKFV